MPRSAFAKLVYVFLLVLLSSFGWESMASTRRCAFNVSAGAPLSADAVAFKAAVDAIVRAWSESNLRSNLEQFVAIWDADAVKMASGRPTVVGAAAIRRAKEKVFATTTYDRFEVDIQEYQLAGPECGWMRGKYLVATRLKDGGKAVTEVGTFLTVFRKQADGSWKVYRDAMMSDGLKPTSE